MASPILIADFKGIVNEALNQVFDEAYSGLSSQLFPEEDPAMYEQEVDFGNE